VGEPWTLLIVRDVFLDLRRFDELQENLGIARNVLTDRLNRLVEEGVLERVRYSQRPERFEYRLTPMGRELNIALTGLRQLGDKYLSEKPPPCCVARPTGSRSLPPSCTGVPRS
jgi:DNA-binding HxlR family transcriptional regulator